MRRFYIERGDVEGARADQIELAEHLIDQYVGFQDKFFKIERVGIVSSVASKTIYATGADTPLSVSDNYYQNCVIEIIGGTGVGERRLITASDMDDKSVTYRGKTMSLDATSVFKIYQLSKFPRYKDAKTYQNVWYKSIPQAVKDAVIAQVKYILEMGDDYFVGDSSDKTSESLGNYSYTRGSVQQSPHVSLIAPKARTILRGIKNNTGKLMVGDEY